MKARQSKLDRFAEQLAELEAERKTLAEMQAWLKEEGCAVSLGRLSEFLDAQRSSRQQERLLAQIASGARQCQEVESALEKNSAPELDTLIKLHRVLILKLSTEGNVDAEQLELVNRMMREVIKFARLEQLAQQNRIEERKLKLLEEKAAQLDKAKEVTESKLTAEEKQLRMKQILG
jgi:DNA-binding phage protein